MTDLRDDLERLADRGAPMSSDEFLARVRSDLDQSQRSRRPSMLVAVLVAAAVLAIAGGIAVLRASVRDQDGTEIVVSAREGSTGWTPAHTIEDGRVHVPMTLPNGLRFTVEYPEAFVEEFRPFALTPGVTAVCRSGECGGATLNALHGSISDYFAAADLIETLPGAQGDVFVYPSPFGGEALVYQFGDWVVRISTQSIEAAERATWARDISATTTTDGFLVYDTPPADSPLRLFVPAGAAGAELTIRIGNAFASLQTEACSEADNETNTIDSGLEPETRHVKRCLHPVGILMRAQGPPDIVETIADALVVASVEDASREWETNLGLDVHSMDPDLGAEDALATGVLTIDASGCSTVGSTRIAWPPGTRFRSGEVRSVELPDGTIFASGSQVRFGGGAHDLAPRTERCRSVETFFVQQW